MKILLYALKEAEPLQKILCEHLKENGIEAITASSQNPAELADKLSENINQGISRAVFLGKTGIDVFARAALRKNLFPVVCHNPLQAEQLRLLGTYFTLCMGYTIIQPKYAVSILDIWLMNDRTKEENKKSQ